MKREMMNMINLCLRKLLARVHSAAVPLVMFAMSTTGGACLGLAQQVVAPTFSSAAEATEALLQAVRSSDERAIANILGGPSELASSGDTAQDKVDREVFVQKFREMHRVGRDADGSETLYLGSENWPFPIPLVEKNGAWHFDSDAGRREVMFRRIGENELRAMVICHELVAAEKQFRADPKTAGQVDSLLAPLVSAAANVSASAEPVLIHGYYFKAVANRQAGGKVGGGFGFIAYPVEYRSSGVMTFLVTANDVVKEKDLGTNTSALANALAQRPKENGWVPCDDK
jgi:Protein of unknown function (DUF2950)